MKEFRTLLFLDWFQGLFTRLGFDYRLLRKILQVKLTMDQRRVPTIFQQQGRKKGKDENRFIKSLWVYALFGLFVIPFILMGDQYIFQMSITFTVLIFIVMTSMISDFSVVILDIRDHTILFTKPVERKTISLAKTLHVFIYLFFLTGSLTAIPLVVGLINHGLSFFILFLSGIILMNILIVVFTAMLYYFILQYFDGEKLKDIINYVQIGLSIGLAVGYQIVARSFEFVDLTISFTPKWWNIFLPPIWFAAPFEWMLNGNHHVMILILSCIAVLFPILALIVYVKSLPTFEKNLQKLSSHGGKKKKAYFRFRDGLIKVLSKSNEERAFYRFAHYMMKNEREFKLKVYPALGFAIIMPFIFIFNGLMDGSREELLTSSMYLSIYSSFIVIPTVVMMLSYSGKYKGSWVYKVAPVSSRASIYKGTLKAFLMKLFLPLYALISIVFIILFGYRVISEIVIVFISACIFTVICLSLMRGALPFSESFEGVQQSDSWKVLPFYLIVGVFLGLHYLALQVPFGIPSYLVILLVVNLILWKTAIRDQ
jgi:ABC-2 type transport system permease protein